MNMRYFKSYFNFFQQPKKTYPLLKYYKKEKTNCILNNVEGTCTCTLASQKSKLSFLISQLTFY